MLDGEKLDIVTAYQKTGYDADVERQELARSRAEVSHALGMVAEELPPHMENFVEAHKRHRTGESRTRRLVGGVPFQIKRDA